MVEIKIIAVGNSAGIILPNDVLAVLGVEKGDSVQVEFEGETLRLVKADSMHARALDAGRECFDRYPTTMAELAR